MCFLEIATFANGFLNLHLFPVPNPAFKLKKTPNHRHGNQETQQDSSSSSPTSNPERD
jgi:hypothetical protein